MPALPRRDGGVQIVPRVFLAGSGEKLMPRIPYPEMDRRGVPSSRNVPSDPVGADIAARAIRAMGYRSAHSICAAAFQQRRYRPPANVRRMMPQRIYPVPTRA